MQADDLEIGKMYYLISYENEQDVLPIITTVRYSECVTQSVGRILYLFKKLVDLSESEVMFLQPNSIDGVLYTIDSLADELQRIRGISR